MKKQAKMSRNKVFVRVCLVLSGMVATYVILSEIHLTRECHRFCTSDGNPVCYLRRTAVLVYDQDVGAHEMSFSQNTHPRINLANYATELASGRYFDINCPVDHYWPRVSTLDRRNSCAIVGNSGILTGSKCGKVIDKHDFIIRANLAPIEGYTADVGERSHLTILNFETLFYLHGNLTQTPPDSQWHEAYVDRVRYLNDSILWYSKSTVQRNSSLHLKDVVHVLKDYYHLPIQLAYSWRPVSIEWLHGLKHYATTGFNAFIIAKTFCDHVTIYGFYPSNVAENGYRINHHYYEDMEFEYQGGIHNFQQEFNKLKEFEGKGDVTIVTDVCPGGKRKKVSDDVKKDSMLDTKFAFNLNSDKLKEIFDISEDKEQEEREQKIREQVTGEQERGEQEAIKQDRTEQERIEQDRTEQEGTDRERTEQVRLEQERIELETMEQDRTEWKRIEGERTEQERTEHDRIEQDRIEQEGTDRERTEQNRTEQEVIERERTGQDRTEQEVINRERTGQDRTEQEGIERKRTGQDRTEQEGIEGERTGQDRTEQEGINRERTGLDRTEQEGIERKRTEPDRTEEERILEEDAFKVSEKQNFNFGDIFYNADGSPMAGNVDQPVKSNPINIRDSYKYVKSPAVLGDHQQGFDHQGNYESIDRWK